MKHNVYNTKKKLKLFPKSLVRLSNTLYKARLKFNFICSYLYVYNLCERACHLIERINK